MTNEAASWDTIRRETGLVEHVCQHGVGHPNHGSALWLAEVQDGRYRAEGADADLEDLTSGWMIHGCDGCCGRDDFPGTLLDSLKHAHGLVRELKQHCWDLDVHVRFLLDRCVWPVTEEDELRRGCWDEEGTFTFPNGATWREDE